MNYLRDDPGAIDALNRCLLANYKNLGTDGAREILRLLGNQDSQDVADALDRHLLSAGARFPPKPGDITEHIRDIETKRRQAAALVRVQIRSRWSATRRNDPPPPGAVSLMLNGPNAAGVGQASGRGFRRRITPSRLALHCNRRFRCNEKRPRRKE